MAEEIIDGSGNGYRAKVDFAKRLHVDAITFGRSEQEVELGNGYNINTGKINLTTANKSAVLWFQNNEDDELVITNIFYILGNSNSNGDTLITILRNPTAGTIVSGAVDADMPGINRNFGSSKTLTATSYKGAEGNTLTDGVKLIESIVQSGKRTILNVGDLVLTKGASVGFEITPPLSNTSMDIQIAFSCFIDTLKDLEGQA
jgi:hypothetical protein